MTVEVVMSGGSLSLSLRIAVIAGFGGLSAPAPAQGPALWLTVTSLDQAGPDCVIGVRLDNHIGFEARQLAVTVGVVAGEGEPVEAALAADVLPQDGSIGRKARVEGLTCAAVTELQLRAASCALGGPGAVGYVCDRAVFYGFSDVPGVVVSYP